MGSVVVPVNANRRIPDLESTLFYTVRNQNFSSYVTYSRLTSDCGVLFRGKRSGRDQLTVRACRSFTSDARSSILRIKDDTADLEFLVSLRGVVGACLAWSLILLWCPPSGGAELAEAHKVIGDTGREIERVVIQALNWPNAETAQNPETGPDVLEFGRWRIPKSPERLLTAFTVKEADSQAGPAATKVKVKADSSIFDKVKEKQEREEKEKAKKEREKNEAKARAAKEEKQRQLEKEKRRREREIRELERRLAVVGGSAVGLGVLGYAKWQTLVTVFAVLFRSVGGPSIISGILGTPGFIFGKQIRAVEWDVAASPSYPNGRMVSFRLRAFTAEGMRKAIAARLRLEGPDEVKQVFHWIEHGKDFYEHLHTPQSFRMLPDPAYVVWSRHARTAEHKIPKRGDEYQLLASANSLLGGLSKEEETVLMLRCISAAGALSREKAAGSKSVGLADGDPTLTGTHDVAIVKAEGGDSASYTSVGGAHDSTGVNGTLVLHLSNGNGPLLNGVSGCNGSASAAACLHTDSTFLRPQDAVINGKATHFASAYGLPTNLQDASSSGHDFMLPPPPPSTEDTSSSGPSRRHVGGLANGSSTSTPPSASLPPSTTPSVISSIDFEDETPSPILLNGKPATLRSAFWSLLGVTEPRLFRRNGGFGATSAGQGRLPGPKADPKQEGDGGRTRKYQAQRSSSRGARSRRGSMDAPVPTMTASNSVEGSGSYRGAASTLERLMKRLTFPEGFQPISDAEEEELVAAAAGMPDAYLSLFRAYGTKDPATFLRYARVLRQRSLEPTSSQSVTHVP